MKIVSRRKTPWKIVEVMKTKQQKQQCVCMCVYVCVCVCMCVYVCVIRSWHEDDHES